MSILNAELSNPDYQDTADETGIRTLGSGSRKYQLDVLNQLNGSAYNMLTKPSGSGKSFEQAVLAVKDVINSHSTRKQLVLVPQVHIANGFFPEAGEPFVFKIQNESKTYRTAVLKEYNFCETPSVDGPVHWLLADPLNLSNSCDVDNETGGLIAMTTYHAFILAFGHMSPAEQIEACRNLHVRADESHHVAMGEQESDDENKTGTILNLLMEHNDNCGITLSTATNFRGDDKCIIRPEVLEQFNRYRLSFLDHFNSIGIETFDVEINQSDTNPTNDIAEQVCLEQGEYHFVVVPPRNAGWRALIPNDPSHGVNGLVATIQEGWHGNCRILNLVPRQEQKKRKAALLSEPEIHDHDNMPQYDVVITCMLGREGTDWCPASRLHVTYVEGSITLAVQTLGRILRKFGNKTKVVARYYFPKFPGPEAGATKSELLNNRKNALLFMTQVDDLFFPIALENVPKASGKEHKGEKPEVITLSDVMGEQAYITMKADFLKQAVDDAVSTGSNFIQQIAEEVVVDHHVPMWAYQQAIDILLASYLRRADVKFRGVNVDFISKHDFQALVGTLTPDGKTLMFHGYDQEHMEKLNSIAKTEFDNNIATLKTYNLKPWDDLSKKLPTELYNFLRQIKRRLSATQAAAAAAGKGK